MQTLGHGCQHWTFKDWRLERRYGVGECELQGPSELRRVGKQTSTGPSPVREANPFKYFNGDRSGCKLRPLPTIFCWAVTLQGRPKELEMIRLMYNMSRACDDFRIYTNIIEQPSFVDLGVKLFFDLGMKHAPEVSKLPGWQSNNTAVFLHALPRAATDGREHDWVIKFDPDMIVIPDRVRYLLSFYDPGKPIAMATKDGYFEEFDIDGPIEVLSRAAVGRLMNGNSLHMRCAELASRHTTEDMFIAACSRSLDFIMPHVKPLFVRLDDRRQWGKQGIYSQWRSFRLETCRLASDRKSLIATAHPYKDLNDLQDCYFVLQERLGLPNRRKSRAALSSSNPVLSLTLTHHKTAE